MENIIEINHLTKKFGQQTILSDVNLTFKSGNIYGFTGRNGSGKTVLLKCICGFMNVTSGDVLLNGKKVKRDMEYLENMGFLIEHPGFLEHLSAFENLKYIASIKRIAGKNEIESSLSKVMLDSHDKKKVGKYSMGMKQRLGVAQAIMENPDILILDEPMNGLDEAGVELMRSLLLEQKRKGVLILIASHYKEDINFLCDKTYCFREGKVVESGLC